MSYNIRTAIKCKNPIKILVQLYKYIYYTHILKKYVSYKWNDSDQYSLNIPCSYITCMQRFCIATGIN